MPSAYGFTIFSQVFFWVLASGPRTGVSEPLSAKFSALRKPLVTSLNTPGTGTAQRSLIKAFSHNLGAFGKADFTRHYVFSEKQSRVNLTRQSFFTRVTPTIFLHVYTIGIILADEINAQIGMYRPSTLTGCISWRGSDVITKTSVRPSLTTIFNRWRHQITQENELCVRPHFLSGDMIPFLCVLICCFCWYKLFHYLGKEIPTFSAALFHWIRGSRIKMKSLKNLLNEVIRENKHMQMKEEVLSITSKRKEKNLQICCTKRIKILQTKPLFEK